MTKNHSAKQVEQFVEDVNGHISVKHPHLQQIISGTNYRRLQNVLQDIQHQAEQAKEVYYVYGISTPLNGSYGAGKIYSYGGPYTTHESAATAAETAINSHGSFGVYRPGWTFFVSKDKLATDL